MENFFKKMFSLFSDVWLKKRPKNFFLEKGFTLFNGNQTSAKGFSESKLTVLLVTSSYSIVHRIFYECFKKIFFFLPFFDSQIDCGV